MDSLGENFRNRKIPNMYEMEFISWKITFEGGRRRRKVGKLCLPPARVKINLFHFYCSMPSSLTSDDLSNQNQTKINFRHSSAINSSSNWCVSCLLHFFFSIARTVFSSRASLTHKTDDENCHIEITWIMTNATTEFLKSSHARPSF